MENKKFNKDREFGVILEKIHSETKILVEGQNLIRDKLDSTIGMVGKNTEDIVMQNIKMSSIKDELIKMNGKLTKMEEDIRIIKVDFGKRLTHLETALK